MAQRRSPPTISAVVAGKFIQYVASRGLDPRPLLQIAGLRPEEARDPERRILISAHCEIWAHAARALDDPALPVRIAQQMRLEDYDVLGFAIGSSKSGREALERLCRYVVLFSEAWRWELDPESAPGEASLRFVWSSGFSLGERLVTETALASCLNGFRYSSGQDFAPIRASFRHPAPRDFSALERYFRCPVEFGAPVDSYSFDRCLLEVVPRGADPALSSFFARHAEELRRRARRAEESGSLADRVRDAIAADLASGEPSMMAVARRIGTSERSLRRHLTEEGTSFRDMVDEVRRGTAEQLLLEGKTSIPDVAFLLGFSDVTTFTRAFKRWCGVPPGKFRERASGVRPGEVEGQEAQATSAAEVQALAWRKSADSLLD